MVLTCSRTTGGEVVRNTIHSFLGAYKTPSMVLDAPKQDIQDALNPVGLQVCQSMPPVRHAYSAV